MEDNFRRSSTPHPLSHISQKSILSSSAVSLHWAQSLQSVQCQAYFRMWDIMSTVRSRQERWPGKKGGFSNRTAKSEKALMYEHLPLFSQLAQWTRGSARPSLFLCLSPLQTLQTASGLSTSLSWQSRAPGTTWLHESSSPSEELSESLSESLLELSESEL